jgi:glycosyltransferase involved in cell wall biosynthesis
MMVSVCMITYNHEAFITQAIEGVLMQRVDFKFELIIGEDCSTDSTRGISEDYANKFPDIIKLLPSERNLGMMPNFIRALNACTGRYIALCEGDDYWTDPYKLQKQVDFLEANPAYGLVHTNYSMLLEENNMITGKRLDNKDNLYNNITFSRLLLGNLIGTLTVCFNKNIFRNFSLDYTRFEMGDYPIWLEFAYHSKIGFIDDNTGVYRVKGNSVSNNKDRNIEFQFFKSIIEIADYYSSKYNLPNKERQDILFRHFENTLNVGYNRSNKFMTQYSYLSIKNQFTDKLTLFHKLLYYGNHRITRLLFKLFIKTYLKIMN